MNDLTQLLLIGGLASLVGFLILALPLLYLLYGGLQPWFAAMAEERAANVSSVTVVRSAPLARRTAARSSGARKLAVSRRPAGKVAKKKSAAKKKAPAKKRAATRGGTTAKKKAVAPAGSKTDSKFGLIYTKRPAQVDDLKKITGVGKVLEGKLQAAGIYTYRQIADWKVAQVKAFDEHLSFKGRIQRDGWKKQAAALARAGRS